MPRLASSLTRRIVRIGHGYLWARVLLAGEVVMIAGRHAALLDGRERRRLIALLADGARHPRTRGADERSELAALVAKLQPRLMLGSAARRLSPVPIPKRVLYGKCAHRAELPVRTKR